MSGYRFDLCYDDAFSERFQVDWQSLSVTLISGYSEVYSLIKQSNVERDSVTLCQNDNGTVSFLD